MKSALRRTLPQIARAVTAAAAMACVASAAFAGYVVDTGMPSGDSNTRYLPLLFNHGGTYFQSWGGSFELASAQTLTAIEGWIETLVETTGTGAVTMSLWSGAPSIDRTPLFATTAYLAPAPPQWVSFGGLNLTVGPGTYAVTFEGTPGYDGYMPAGAPSPLSVYYFRGSSGDWRVDYPTVGVRVAAVPELETFALMAAGLGIVGLALRRRKA